MGIRISKRVITIDINLTCIPKSIQIVKNRYSILEAKSFLRTEIELGLGLTLININFTDI